MKVLKKYDWPGNVRELQNVITRLLLQMVANKIEELDIMQSIDPISRNEKDHIFSLEMPESVLVKEYAQYIFKKMNKAKTKTANVLCIDLKTLQKRLGKEIS
ncbi:MAG: hypothetical protein HRT90_07270 [Candidatus Margulisbacteria bacterium]|nr:hypothetical protein [Candidatus Margulisiibacteriota bacterium]